MKKGLNLNINFSNRWIYFLVTLGIFAIIAVGVHAYNSNPANPAVMGHSMNEISPPSGCSSSTPYLKSDGTTWSCGSVSIQSSSWTDPATSVNLQDNGADSGLGIQSSAPAGANIVMTSTAAGGTTFFLQSTANTAGQGPGKLVIGSSSTFSPGILTLTSDGNVGIGTSSPAATKLEVDQNSNGNAITAKAFNNGGNGISAYGGSGGAGVWASGDVSGGIGVKSYAQADDFYAWGPGTHYGVSSSIRWKDNITEIPNALDKVLNLSGVYFNWKIHNESHAMGFIAEDVGKVVPEVVSYETDLTNSSNYYIENGKKVPYATGVDYGALTPVLVEAIKQQQAQIETLKSQMQEICKKDKSYSWCR